MPPQSAQPGPQGALKLQSVSPLTAILVAIPIAVLVVVLLEAARVPWSVISRSAESPFQVFLLGLRGAFDFLWAPILFQLYVAVMVAGRPAWLRRGIVSWVLSGAIVAGVCAYSYVALTSYGPFRAYPPFMVLFGSLFVFLLWWVRTATSESTEAGGGGLRRLLRWALPACGLLGFAVSTVLNRRLFPDAYPTLHLSVLQASYLLLHAGLAALLVALPRVPRGPRLLRWAAGGVLLHLVVLTSPLVDSGLCDPARPAFLRFTDIGRSYALRSVASAPSMTGARVGKTATRVPSRDPLGLTRFSAHSNLPRLPGKFRLAKYNVLIVSVDAFRFRETDLYNPGASLTPRIASLAKQGAYWFERAYSSAPGTLQSFSSLLTMTYPSMAGISLETAWHGKLSSAATTVPELLKGAGYRTFYSGHNFRLHFGHGAKIQGLLQGIEDLRLGPGGPTDNRSPTQDAIIRANAEKALDAARKEKRKFFGWVFFESPHAPYLAHYPQMPGKTDHQRYRQEVRYVDAQIGKLFDYLDRTGLRKSTVVIVLSDHGEGFGLHKKLRHADVYSEITRVPLLVFVPGAKGGKIAKPTSLLYVLPWLLLHGPKAVREAAVTKIERDIGPMLQQTEGAIVSEMLCSDCARTALVYPEHRLIYDLSSGYTELYDLRTDPDEQRNIFDAAAPVSKRYLRRLEGYLRVRAARQNVATHKGSKHH